MRAFLVMETLQLTFIGLMGGTLRDVSAVWMKLMNTFLLNNAKNSKNSVKGSKLVTKMSSE